MSFSPLSSVFRSNARPQNCIINIFMTDLDTWRDDKMSSEVVVSLRNNS